jgi:hypothetical protein
MDTSRTGASAQWHTLFSPFGRHGAPEFIDGDTVEECEAIDHGAVSNRQEP